MVQGQPGRHELRASHHVARHCRGRDIRNDGTVSPAAFEVRPGEEYLSTNWLEYFHDSHRLIQIVGVRQALIDKGFRVRPTASFAVLNVGAAIAACKNVLNLDIQILTLAEPHDPSHTGIYGYSVEDVGVAALLAASIIPNEVYPAAS